MLIKKNIKYQMLTAYICEAHNDVQDNCKFSMPLSGQVHYRLSVCTLLMKVWNIYSILWLH